MDDEAPAGVGHMKLVARPRSLFTFEFDVLDDSETVVASFRHRAFRATGSITVDGEQFEVRRVGTGLAVESDGRRPVKVESSGRGQMQVEWKGGRLQLARAGLGFRLHVIADGALVGSLGLRDLFGRTMIFDMEREVPPLVAAALFYLAVARRRQLLMIGS